MTLLNARTWLADLHLARPPCNLDIRDNQGCTPLHRAAMAGFNYIVEKLLLAGADATIEDNERRTASFYSGNQQTYQWLQEADKQRREARLMKKKAKGRIRAAGRMAAGVGAGEAREEAIRGDAGAGAGAPGGKRRKPQSKAKQKAAFRAAVSTSTPSPYG